MVYLNKISIFAYRKNDAYDLIHTCGYEIFKKLF